jgi:hypothetical protein
MSDNVASALLQHALANNQGKKTQGREYRVSGILGDRYHTYSFPVCAQSIGLKRTIVAPQLPASCPASLNETTSGRRFSSA